MALETAVRGGGGLDAPATRLLDNPVWAALAGPHADSAERVGDAARHPADVHAFAALADPDDQRAWADPRRLLGPGHPVRLKGVDAVPDGWETVGGGHGVQLVDTSPRAEEAPRPYGPGHHDVPEMLYLVSRTRPGPFLARTAASPCAAARRSSGSAPAGTDDAGRAL
ncbi:hypothetical protein ACFYZJ_07620 [Streptomyces sp. NPDC001848]|uniref:hypothetical protein n=1 Tax=Streptomyces sp. NPDC001848 TaxID=3364618 RepID=UPI0036CB8708